MGSPLELFNNYGPNQNGFIIVAEPVRIWPEPMLLLLLLLLCTHTCVLYFTYAVTCKSTYESRDGGRQTAIIMEIARLQ